MECTLVSIIPTMILERKPGMVPGAFTMPPAKENDFELLLIPDCRYYIYLDGDRGSIAAYKPGEEVAESVVRDYIDSKPNVSPEAHPGIGFVPGNYVDQKEKFKKDHSDILKRLDDTQNLWFAELVKVADDEWERHRAHRAISDEQRLAAKRLHLMDRPYLISIPDSKLVNCKGCYTQISAKAVICPNCRTILDDEAYAKLKRVA